LFGRPLLGVQNDHAFLLAWFYAAYLEKDCDCRGNDYNSAVHVFRLYSGKRSCKGRKKKAKQD
jgi:hypothetical protein